MIQISRYNFNNFFNFKYNSNNFSYIFRAKNYSKILSLMLLTDTNVAAVYAAASTPADLVDSMEGNFGRFAAKCASTMRIDSAISTRSFSTAIPERVLDGMA